MIAQSMLGEFDHEFAVLRKVLERVPEGKSDFKPHGKSMSLGRLAGHLAELPVWLNMTLGTDELDFTKAEYKPYVMGARADLLALLDKNVAAARAVLAEATDQNMLSTWTLRNGATVIFTLPKVAVIRSMVLNHMVHHRGQMSVYLRLNDVPVPSIYGPSADEGGM